MIAESDGMEGLVGAEYDGAADVIPSKVINVGNLDLIGSQTSLLVNDEMVGAAFGQDLRGTFGAEVIPIVRQLDDDTHGFPLA